MRNEIIGIKPFFFFFFNPVADTVLLFCLQGQLGLGEERTHISTPCLLSYSQLAEVTRLQAGDSYSAAITGEPSIQPAVVAPQREVFIFTSSVLCHTESVDLDCNLQMCSVTIVIYTYLQIYIKTKKTHKSSIQPT